MSLQYDEIGRRLKAFRLASGLSVDEIAERIGVSRTALYRFEKGELAKIETLEKLSELLQVSMPTLLGVGVEYMPSAVGYFERTRQLEETADQIIVLAGPISFLLASDQFEIVLEQVLRESVPDDVPHRQHTLADVDKVMEILHARKQTYKRRRPSIVNLISSVQIERFLKNGLMGRPHLSEAKRHKRLDMARQEIEHFAELIEQDSMGVQIGVITDNLPHNGFQIFRQAERSTITISPFRLGEQPNIRIGVAMATSAPEAVMLHKNIVQEVWRTAIKGPAASEFLRGVLAAPQHAAAPAARKRSAAPR
jgi:transcriptional regulator with XRE-family HTH domain